MKSRERLTAWHSCDQVQVYSGCCTGLKLSPVVIFMGYMHISLLGSLNSAPPTKTLFCCLLMAVLQLLQQKIHLQLRSAEKVSLVQNLFWAEFLLTVQTSVSMQVRRLGTGGIGFNCTQEEYGLPLFPFQRPL